ncbi:MAG: hypothetical protein GX807_00885 [Erysipelotrichia bacterium]|nr:hypothetical protein [Erysipelotrichia bacterium]
MDLPFVSASLGVKIADLRKIESQLFQLDVKSNDELVNFLNHLQIGGSVEAKDLETLLLEVEKHFFGELLELFDEDGYHYLDLAFADEILTLLNLKLHELSFDEKFKKYDYLHLSLKDLLAEEGSLKDNYRSILQEVENASLNDPRASEALLVKVYYDDLRKRFKKNPYLLAKEYALNTRTLLRAARFKFSFEDYASELLGDDVLKEKYQGFYLLDLNQLEMTLKEKVEPAIGELFHNMLKDTKSADHYVDLYLENKISDLLFSDEVVDLLIVYMMISKRIVKYLKKVAYQVDDYE